MSKREDDNENGDDDGARGWHVRTASSSQYLKPPLDRTIDENLVTEPIKVPSRTFNPQSQMYRSTSHASGPDGLEPPSPSPSPPPGPNAVGAASSGAHPKRDEFYEAGDEVYNRLSPRRKAMIVAVMAFCAFLSPISSTSVLSATPEVARDYHTSGSVIDICNAVYMVFMGLAPIVWGPVSQVWGRWPVQFLTAILFFLLSLATALAPNLASFFIFRILSAFEGTAFILVGAAVIGDIYRPTERGTAVGWFMSGTLIGPAFGPFIGGIIVTYSSWRSIFWLQSALAFVAGLGIFFLVPETIHRKKILDLQGFSRKEKIRKVSFMINPVQVLRWLRFGPVALCTLASSSLVWNMYSLLTPIQYVLNPRFHLQTPLLGGLFYLAPGVGYLLGTFGGGRWADATVKKWIRKRGGKRVPEDRLRSALPFIGIIMPGCILVYGWTVDQKVGGIPVPVIALFLQGVGQLFCFPSLNTYCLDVYPGYGAEVTAANFFVRYLSGCVGTAVVLPAIQGIGLGWFCTISSLFMIVSAVGLYCGIIWGPGWRKEAEEREKAEAQQSQVLDRSSVSAPVVNGEDGSEERDIEKGQ